jgi:2-Cys peroxiredoxin 5
MNRLIRTPLRSFSTTTRRLLQVGDQIPSVSTLREGSPGNVVDLAELTKQGKSIIVGVPGAFSPACSASHVPGYLNNLSKFEQKGYKVFVTGVNDSFVFKAWGESLNADPNVSCVPLYLI